MPILVMLVLLQKNTNCVMFHTQEKKDHWHVSLPALKEEQISVCSYLTQEIGTIFFHTK